MKKIAVPLRLVELLSDGEFHSGEQLGDTVGMTRAAVNKHIHTLRDWGLDIFRVTGKGYRLAEPLSLLNAEKIQQFNPQAAVTVIPVIDSTNQYLMERIDQLAVGDVCVAEYQQAGRGRRGRHWTSPFGANLYYSMYWRLEQGPAAAVGLSLVIGIVMAEVLHDLGANDVRVKWPNDLYLKDRKLAGILVEMTAKAGDCAHIVIGAGINLSMGESSADAIDQGWINLQESGVRVDRNQLVATLVSRLTLALQAFERQGLAHFLKRWKAIDNFIDRPVKLLIGDKEIQGINRGINEQGALLLDIDGTIHAFVGGEISLRGIA